MDGLPSRSTAVQRATHLLTHRQLEQDYTAAWAEWDGSGDRDAWEGVTADGLRRCAVARSGWPTWTPCAGVGLAGERRPAVVGSNDQANAVAERLGRGVVTVVPVASNTTRVFPFQVLSTAGDTGLHVDSKAQAEQVRAVSVDRLGPAVGSVPLAGVAGPDDALRLHLTL